MFKVGFVVAAAIACAGVGTGCGGRQQMTQAQSQTLQQNADAALDAMIERDPGLRQVLPKAAAYAVFPDVGQAGVLVGGAYGHGVLYEHDEVVGIVTLSQGSVGFQLGAQTFSELLVLNDPDQIRGAQEWAVRARSGCHGRGTKAGGCRGCTVPQWRGRVHHAARRLDGRDHRQRPADRVPAVLGLS